MRWRWAALCVGLGWAGAGCQKTAETGESAAASPVASMSRADALALVPDPANLLAAVDVTALVRSGTLGGHLDQLSAAKPLEPLTACGFAPSRVRYVVFGGGTTADAGFVAVLSSPDVTDTMLECVAKQDPAADLRTEHGRTVLAHETGKLYAVAPGVLAFAAPAYQSALEARLEGRGVAAAEGTLQAALAGANLDADVILAMRPDAAFAQETPGLRSIAAEADLSSGLAVTLVSRFDDAALAQRVAQAVDPEGWRVAARNLGVSSGFVDTLKVDVEDTTATGRVQLTADELQQLSAVVAKALREELDLDTSAPTQGLDESDEDFLLDYTLERQVDAMSKGWDTDTYDRCMAKFVPELDSRIRQAYCRCVEHDMLVESSSASIATEDCGLMLQPIVLRSGGMDMCKSIHGADTCACLQGTRKTSRAAYELASARCLE